MTRWWRYALRIIALLLCVLIPFGIDHIMSVVSGDPCEPHIEQPSGLEGLAETWIYKLYIGLGVRDTRSRYTAVVVLTKQDIPEEIFSNICRQRPFLAAVIGQVAEAGASQIVLDKYFSPTACDDPSANAALLQSVTRASARVPIVIGISTIPRKQYLDSHRGLPEEQRRQLEKACLVVENHLDFGNLENVHYGVLRADSDLRRIALEWPVFPDSTKIGSIETWLSLPAVSATNADGQILRRRVFSRDLKENIHPMTSFIQESDFPTISAAALACSADYKLAGLQCPSRPDLSAMRGKVVFVGEEVPEKDVFPTPVGEMSGVFLQANYVESLLDDRYFKVSPTWAEILMALAWAVMIEFWFAYRKSASLGPLARPFLLTMLVFIVCSWVVFQVRFVLIFFGIPAAAIALGLRSLEKWREDVS